MEIKERQYLWVLLEFGRDEAEVFPMVFSTQEKAIDYAVSLLECYIHSWEDADKIEKKKERIENARRALADGDIGDAGFGPMYQVEQTYFYG